MTRIHTYRLNRPLPTPNPPLDAAISAVINAAISAAVYWALFRGTAAVPVWGPGNFAFDFVPQGFMVALMGSLIPAVLLRRRRRQRAVAGPSNAHLVANALGYALGAALLGGAITSLLLWALDIGSLPFLRGLAVKMGYAVLLSVIVTPAMLRGLFGRETPA